LQIIANHCKSLQIIAIILLTSTEILYSQIQCGTPALTSQERSELITFIESLESRGPMPNTPVQIPIHLFVISDDNGNLMNNGKDYIKLTKEALVEATQLFDNGMEFFLCDLTFISNTTHHEMTGAVDLYNFIHNDLGYPHNAITVVVNKEVERSFATSPGFTVSIVRFTIGNLTNSFESGRIFAHEFGHYFGLLHTDYASNIGMNLPGGELFLGTPVFSDCSCNTLAPAVCSADYVCESSIPDCNGVQNVLPCNCCNSGDLISDTPVDPGATTPPTNGPCNSSLTGSSPCTVINKLIPANGPVLQQTVDYYPAYSNIMSGYNAAATFSDEQKQRTLDILWYHDSRAFLIDSNSPTCNDYFVAADDGTVKKIYFDPQQNQWQTEPVANVSMIIENNIQTQTCTSSSNPPDGTYSSNCFINATDIDATVTQEQSFNEIFNPVFTANNGVSTLDLVRITRHILTIEQLENPYYWIAADANNSGAITTQDVIKVRKIVLGLEQSFNPVPSWRFMPLYYLHNQWNFVANFNVNPFSAELNYADGTTRKYLSAGSTPSYLDRLDIVQYNEDIEESETWSFVMIKTGDVNGSATIESTPPPNDNTVLQEEPHACLEQSQTAAINIIAEDNTPVSGYQLALFVDPDYLEITGVNKGGISPFSQDYFNLEELATGKIKALWYDELAGGNISIAQPKSLFQIYVKAKDQVCHIEQVLMIDTSAMVSAFYDEDGHELTPGLSVTLTPQTIRNQLFTIYPNPATNEIYFEFKVNDQPAQLNISVQDQYSNLIQHNQQYQPGTYTYTFSNTGALQNGLLSYSVAIGSDQFSGNIIKVQ
jgi:hypothetical protein